MFINSGVFRRILKLSFRYPWNSESWCMIFKMSFSSLHSHHRRNHYSQEPPHQRPAMVLVELGFDHTNRFIQLFFDGWLGNFQSFSYFRYRHFSLGAHQKDPFPLGGEFFNDSHCWFIIFIVYQIIISRRRYAISGYVSFHSSPGLSLFLKIEQPIFGHAEYIIFEGPDIVQFFFSSPKCWQKHPGRSVRLRTFHDSQKEVQTGKRSPGARCIIDDRPYDHLAPIG